MVTLQRFGMSDAQKELHVQPFKWALTCKPGALRHIISDGKAIDKITKPAIAKWNTDKHFLNCFMIYLPMLYT